MEQRGGGESGAEPESGWAAVEDELVAGVHHALNNRIGALAAVAQVLEGELDEAHPLRAALGHEVERLQDTVRSLEWLRLSRDDAAPEPVQLRDMVSPLVQMYGYHHGVRDTACRVELAPDLFPLWVNPLRLGHTLLVLLVAAGQEARRRGAEVRLEITGDAERAVVRIRQAEREVEMPWALPEVEAPSVDAASVRGWVERMGGELTREEGPAGTGYRLVLPTLPAVRRREREQGS